MRKRADVRRAAAASLLAMSAAGIYFSAVFRSVVVVGASMEPTHPAGTRFLATRAYWLVGPIRKGDVVAVVDPDDDRAHIIKRVAAMGGEAVDAEKAPFSWQAKAGPYRAPMGRLYLLGDNAAASEDSRAFGPVPESSVVGKCVHLFGGSMTLPYGFAVGGIMGMAGLWALAKRPGSP